MAAAGDPDTGAVAAGAAYRSAGAVFRAAPQGAAHQRGDQRLCSRGHFQGTDQPGPDARGSQPGQFQYLPGDRHGGLHEHFRAHGARQARRVPQRLLRHAGAADAGQSGHGHRFSRRRHHVRVDRAANGPRGSPPTDPRLAAGRQCDRGVQGQARCLRVRAAHRHGDRRGLHRPLRRRR